VYDLINKDRGVIRWSITFPSEGRARAVESKE